jgi:small subunit ribosomal protein S20
MANTRSSAKRARQTKTRTAANRSVLTGVKNKLKAARTAIKTGNKDEAASAARAVISAMDRAAKSGRVHKNKANRTKSRLAKAITALGTAPAA